MTIGRIHSIETFGTVDGPGIRYVVFTQGCQLRCRYCHNRDTWDTSAGKEISADDLIKDALKYKTFYTSSGGGITVSGGEATLQPEFVKEVFKLAKENGLGTCLDTNGLITIPQSLDDLLKYTDLVLLDIKHMVPEKSKWLTGANSDNAMKFAKYLDEKGIHMWIRHVLVPGITDTKKNLSLLSNFIKNLKNMDRLELLPYHVMGVNKWEKLGKEYTLKDIRSATEDDVKKAKSYFDFL